MARLVDNQQIALDTPINNYLADLPNPAWREITPRMLLSHMSGIAHYPQRDLEKDYYGLYLVLSLSKHYDDMRSALEVFDGTSMRSKSGTEFYYSSQGTVLLAAVMAAEVNKPYM